LPLGRMTPPAVPVTYWIGMVAEAKVTTVAGRLSVGAGATRGIVVVDDFPRTMSALPVDCRESTWEEKVMTSPGRRVTPPGKTTAGDDV
jgi:hypothetical protein